MSLFTDVQFKVPKKRRFNRSFESMLSHNFGELRIACVEECFPGDTHKISLESSTKLAPLVAPSFCRIDVYYHWFFVPSRILYSGFENFITGGTDGTSPNGSKTTPVATYVDIGDLYNSSDNYLKAGSLADEVGMPSFENYQGAAILDVPPISTLPWLAYKKIFSDWYRDELLDSYEYTPVGDGDIKQYMTIAELNKRYYRAWKKDYFTSARPDTQLGAEESIPINGEIGSDGPFRMFKSSQTTGTQGAYLGNVDVQASGGSLVDMYYSSSLSGNKLTYAEGLTLDQAGILINDLRRSLKAQEWKEKNMRGGNRYIENIFNHFGVKSSDARLQRSQYLGGRKIPVVIGEVLQSVDQNSSTPAVNSKAQGARAGVASAAGNTNYIKHFSEEHGWLMCIVSIMPHAVYQQGIPRYLADRWDRFEYMWPEFGNLGEQEVYNWELYVAPGANAGNDGVFGYQSRYADLKTRSGECHGDFRKTALDFYANARKFSARPQLNSGFVYFPSANDAGGQNRIFVVPGNSSGDHFWTHLFFKMSVLRQLPRYGIPSI